MGMKNNKKGWLARDYIVSMLVLSGLIALGFLMVQSSGTEYSNTGIIDDNFDDNYNQLQKFYNIFSERGDIRI